MKKILIIDDDADLRQVYKTVLGKTYQVQEAASAAEGRKAVANFKPDLVILDVMMEESSSGFDLAREIKGGKTPPKILMLTSIDSKMNLQFSETAGDSEWLPVDDFTPKPVDPKTLLSKVEKLV